MRLLLSEQRLILMGPEVPDLKSINTVSWQNLVLQEEWSHLPLTPSCLARFNMRCLGCTLYRIGNKACVASFSVCGLLTQLCYPRFGAYCVASEYFPYFTKLTTQVSSSTARRKPSISLVHGTERYRPAPRDIKCLCSIYLQSGARRTRRRLFLHEITVKKP